MTIGTKARGNSISNQPGDLGLVHFRFSMPTTRRSFAKGALAGAAAAAMGLHPPRAMAATEIKYMGWQGYDDGLNVDGWFDTNDIILQPTYIASVEEIIAAAAGGGMGVFDLCVPGDVHMSIFEHAGLLEPLDLKRLPNWDNVFPAIQERFTVTDDAHVFAVPFMWGSLPLMYNAEAIPEPPTSWMDQFKPEYKGKVGMIQELTGNMVWAVRAANDIVTTARATQPQLDRAVELLIRLKKEAAHSIIPSYGDLATMFATGEIWLGSSWEPISVWAGEEAPDLKWVIPEEGCLCFVDALAVVKDSPNKDECYKILNHAMSAAAQAETANINGTAATCHVAVPLLSEENKAIYPYDDIEAWLTQAGPFEKWPHEADGDIVTFDTWVAAWERVLQA